MQFQNVRIGRNVVSLGDLVEVNVHQSLVEVGHDPVYLVVLLPVDPHAVDFWPHDVVVRIYWTHANVLPIDDDDQMGVPEHD